MRKPSDSEPASSVGASGGQKMAAWGWARQIRFRADRGGWGHFITAERDLLRPVDVILPEYR